MPSPSRESSSEPDRHDLTAPPNTPQSKVAFKDMTMGKMAHMARLFYMFSRPEDSLKRPVSPSEDPHPVKKRAIKEDVFVGAGDATFD